MGNSTAGRNTRLVRLRLLQWSALVVAMMGLLVLIHAMNWSIPLGVAGEIVDSADPENFEVRAAVLKRWLVVGGLTVPLGMYALFVSRSIRSPEAISAGEPPSRMFPTFLCSKLELCVRGWSLGGEGSLNMAEVINPQPQQLDFNKMIDVLRGNAPTDRPLIGASAFIRTEW